MHVFVQADWIQSTDYFSSIKFLFSFYGAPVFEPQIPKRRHVLGPVIWELSAFVAVVMSWIEAYRYLPDVFRSTEPLLIGITCFNATLKLHFLRRHIHDFQWLMSRIRELTLNQSDVAWKHDILKNGARLVKIIMNGFLRTFLVCILAAGAVPLALLFYSDFKIRQLPLKMWFPVPDSWTGYYIKFAFEMFLNCTGTINFTFGYTAFCASIIYITNQMKILANDIQSSDEGSPDEVADQATLIRWAQHHDMIIKLVERMNNTFGIPVFLEIVLSSFQSCLVLYQFSSRPLSDPTQTFFISFLFCTTVMPLSICWCGQELKSHSLLIREAIYSHPWYKMPPKLRKDVIMLQRQANKALTLHSWLFVLDLSAFAKTLQTAYSYYTILKTVDTV